LKGREEEEEEEEERGPRWKRKGLAGVIECSLVDVEMNRETQM
jgi:hypothetical protein